MEQTLTIIKPDAVQRNLTGKILARLEAEGFVVLGMKMVYMSKADAERFYHVHQERPFFDSLTSFMSSGPAVPMVLQRDNAIETLRGAKTLEVLGFDREAVDVDHGCVLAVTGYAWVQAPTLPMVSTTQSPKSARRRRASWLPTVAPCWW